MEQRTKDLRYAVQHPDRRKSDAKIAKKCKPPTKYIRNLIIYINIFKIYQFLYQYTYIIAPK
jgi:hypothetical protein